MCGISGMWKPEGGDLREVAKMLAFSKIRGRDAYGVVAKSHQYGLHRRAAPGEPGNLFNNHESQLYYLGTQYNLAIANNRAEPTTEFVKELKSEDLQPYISGDVAVVHNGTIANDAELAEHLGIERPKIDSMVIAPLIKKYNFPDAIRMLKGSFAIAAIVGDDLWLACNYKPIFYGWLDEEFYFASLPEFLPNGVIPQQMEPYTMWRVTKAAKQYLLTPDFETNNKALVICSGGLDSTVVATYYVKSGFDVTLLHFTYGCKAEKKEVEAIRKIASFLNCDHIVLDMSNVLGGRIGGSSLTDPTLKVNKTNGGEAAAEYAYEWVPARNLIFYSLALAYAEAHRFGKIALGNNLEEAGAYPDNEMIFVRKFQEIVPFAVQEGRAGIQIDQPVGNLMKHEIVKWGMEMGAPLDLTWSCYEAGENHCGECGPCYMRKKAFRMNEIEEVIQYEAL